MDFWSTHKRNAVILLAGVALILAFIFLGIVPNTEKLSRQKDEMASLREKIDSEKVLLPIYLRLKKENESFPPCALPNPGPEVLGRANADRITGMLKTAAGESGMKLIGAVPSINSLTETGRFLSVLLMLNGRFQDFRDFLTRLGGIACVRAIERIEIKSVPGGKVFELTVWFAVGGGGEAEEPKEGAVKKAV